MHAIRLLKDTAQDVHPHEKAGAALVFGNASPHKSDGEVKQGALNLEKAPGGGIVDVSALSCTENNVSMDDAAQSDGIWPDRALFPTTKSVRLSSNCRLPM